MQASLLIGAISAGESGKCNAPENELQDGLLLQSNTRAAPLVCAVVGQSALTIGRGLEEQQHFYRGGAPFSRLSISSQSFEPRKKRKDALGYWCDRALVRAAVNLRMASKCS